MADYTYGKGSTITVRNDGDQSIYVYNYALEARTGQQIIPIDEQAYIRLAAQSFVDIKLPDVVATPDSGRLYQSNSLYFSRSRLTESLEINRLPDIGNGDVDGDVPFSAFEYNYLGPAPFVAGGLSADVTLIDAFSYPIQWQANGISWGLGGRARFDGDGPNGPSLGALDLVRAWMAAVPFTNPENFNSSPPTPATITANLIWQGKSNDILDNNRIVGPSKLWTYGSTLPGFLPESFSTFCSTFPAEGQQLAMAGAFGTPNASSPSNNNGWQIVKPREDGGPGVSNGFTYALQQAARALDGIKGGVLGNIVLPDAFQGFYTYPQENVLGGITFLADQFPVTINVGSLSSATTIGGPSNDAIYGTNQSEVITGGYGGDVLSGGPGRDAFLFLRSDSSLPGDGLDDIFSSLRGGSGMPWSGQRDVITDFDPSEDKLDFSLFDHTAGSPDELPLRFIGAAAFTGQAGELRFVPMQLGSVANGLVQGDFDGDGSPDLEVILLGVNTLSEDAFNL
ncbi:MULTISPECIES: hypothetical protein [unclassified Synechococcus]|uniref:hypothetical protein n=1 Tax=unclassified Synechococcus TaxID=2626047 RepID=UPI0000698FF6|nr:MULTISPECIES: hypothetical protein [unclassified Synechococcus]EAQ74241.1 Peptidase M10A and M12B, matrixin and adamalysin [Synechococcus sp. WH 5701]WFN60032.1 hypothetical protein N4320_05520 [Synechococcus sp. CCFWC 502]